MAKFDVMDATKYGYATAWGRRADIMRHVMTPLLVKIGALAAVLFLGLEQNYLRQGLVMLPAFFAEGFLVAYILRMVFLGDDIPRDVRAIDINTARDLVAGMIVYVLIKLALAFMVGMTLSQMDLQGAMLEGAAPDSAGEDVPPPNMGTLLAPLFIFGFTIWAFRFLWLYIPVALGQRLDDFWERISGFKSSLPMFACWMMCLLPFGFGMMIYMNFVIGMFPVPEGAEVSQGAKLLILMGQAVIELAMIIVSSLAMAWGFKNLKD
ncbi:MAG: hypothetical protein ACRBCT_07455 [Alphaproteobacteria bacterium]